MEEKQIQEFVHRASRDQAFRQELLSNPESVIAQEGFSSRVAQIVTQLIPYLSLEDKDILSSYSNWWRW